MEVTRGGGVSHGGSEPVRCRRRQFQGGSRAAKSARIKTVVVLAKPLIIRRES